MLVTINEDQSRALARFLELIEPALERVGAEIVERYRIEEGNLADGLAKTIIAMEYPSRDAMDAVFASDEYKKAAPFRDAAFSTYSVHVVE